MVDKSSDYLMSKGGIFYFTRHLPNDVPRHYDRSCIVMCPKTTSKKMALRACHFLVGKLDGFWLQMRIFDIDIPALQLRVKG